MNRRNCLEILGISFLLGNLKITPKSCAGYDGQITKAGLANAKDLLGVGEDVHFCSPPEDEFCSYTDKIRYGWGPAR